MRWASSWDYGILGHTVCSRHWYVMVLHVHWHIIYHYIVLICRDADILDSLFRCHADPHVFFRWFSVSRSQVPWTFGHGQGTPRCRCLQGWPSSFRRWPTRVQYSSDEIGSAFKMFTFTFCAHRCWSIILARQSDQFRDGLENQSVDMVATYHMLLSCYHVLACFSVQLLCFDLQVFGFRQEKPMKNGATPVHLAAQCGHVEVVRPTAEPCAMPSQTKPHFMWPFISYLLCVCVSFYAKANIRT